MLPQTSQRLVSCWPYRSDGERNAYGDGLASIASTVPLGKQNDDIHKQARST